VCVQGLGDFCIEPNEALEDLASNYVEKGILAHINGFT